jgi:hypothetical protein
VKLTAITAAINVALLAISIGGCSFNSPHIDPSESADTRTSVAKYTHRATTSKTITNSLICDNAQRYAKQVIGDGHCVALIKACTGAPNTSDWRPGELVVNQNLMQGTVIATFKGDRYPSRSGWHAAIYSHQDRHGIWVWDQWQGKPVGLRLIRHQVSRGAKPANRASNYRVVLANPTQAK